MSNVDVVEVETKAQLKQFITYPNRLYKGDANYVTPLLMERKEFFDTQTNPFFRSAKTHLFLAKRNGEVVGRIATCVNYRHNEFHMEKTGFFGFFDTPDDENISQVLLKVAMITLKKAGMDKMRGPMNFSTNHECGFLVKGFDSPPMVMMTYNYPYQVTLAEKFGLKKVMDLYAYRVDSEAGIPERLQRVVDRLKKRSKVTVRPIDMGDYDKELDRVKQVYDSGWERNWGFVPMNKEEFNHMAANLKQILDPSVVLLAEYEGKPIGFSLALPDINKALIRLNGRLFPFGLAKLLWHTKVRSKMNSVRLVIFGVVPDFQRRGIDSILFIETFNRGTAAGYKWAELSWILETNELMRRAAVEMGGDPYKKYRVVEMPI
ncbi:MAG: N-acetyltransferase [Candidatus Zixiibacteriota bacterium]|nr:MAG: N-acetyltransferase [candidate division Zixibacteria bacterium]